MNARKVSKAEKELIPLNLFVPILLAIFGYLQFRNWFIHALPQGLSDIPAFYRMRFGDGLHHWPYNSYVPLGKTSPLNPIEYPSLIGLIVWMLSFFVKAGENAALDYFLVNAIFIALLFAASSFLLEKISQKKLAKYYYLSPAVVLSLFLNWDIWVVVPMLAAIYYFEKQRNSLSSIWLAIAISTKFFPVMLLIPVVIAFIRKREIKLLFRYVTNTLLTWLAINIPFMITNFSGWTYFYRFSFKRGIGEGSFFTIFEKFGLAIGDKNLWYYGFNAVLYISFISYLLLRKESMPLRMSAFLSIFVFTIFGKQYSMQYVLWLTPLAIYAISCLSKINQKFMLRIYLIWQLSELLFNTAYFNNLWWSLSDQQTGIPNEEYAMFAILRYLIFLVFTYFLIDKERAERKSEHKLAN